MSKGGVANIVGEILSSLRGEFHPTKQSPRLSRRLPRSLRSLAMTLPINLATPSKGCWACRNTFRVQFFRQSSPQSWLCDIDRLCCAFSPFYAALIDLCTKAFLDCKLITQAIILYMEKCTDCGRCPPSVQWILKLSTKICATWNA